MTLLAVQVESRYVLRNVADPEHVLEWLDCERELCAENFGHAARIVLLDDPVKAHLLRRRNEDTFRAALHGDVPLLNRWSPAAWPARTCALSPRLVLPHTVQS